VFTKQVIVALDFSSAEEATALVERLDPKLCGLKVGKELFVAAGPSVVSDLVESGFEVFLDLKFHDIPNTVASACKAAARLGVCMLNVHASGGRNMMTAARETLEAEHRRPLLIAVTVLTSLAEADILEVGLAGSAADNVMRLARLTHACGLDGVVCSAREAAALRADLPRAFKLVTPGIRLPSAAADDQQRIVTPLEAVKLGSDYLVIGRPITRAAEPIAVLQAIIQGLSQETT
jgi:orotidine-5'-phosphate decarboxylase